MERETLKEVGTHFAFGENWASYAHDISENKIIHACSGLERLLGASLQGKRFLDIGCGSGIHSLAAIRMGADEVVAIDIDKDSVATTHEVLSEMALAARFRTECISVFDLDPQRLGGPFDVVYSWGVLHHTGNMKQAIAKAGDMVATGGLFVLALYRRTWMCPLWRLEKRWYTQASRRMQGGARWVYEKLFRLSGGLSFDVDSYIRDYPVHRGMDFAHDVHDWLGGYPYESVLPVEVDRLLTTLGFQLQSSFLCKPTPGKLHGFMGTGCDEYVYSRVSG